MHSHNATDSLRIILVITTLLLEKGIYAEAPWVPRRGNDNLVTDPPPEIQSIIDQENKTPEQLRYIDEFEQGLLNIWAYNATPNNADDDDTENIQNALYAAYQYNLVCYFPTGTYHVTDMLECDQAIDNNRRYTFQLLGQKKIDTNGNPVRPVIQLKDNSPDFDNTSSTGLKPILKIWGRDVLLEGQTSKTIYENSENPPNTFGNMVRGIDISTGVNPGAACIYFSGAQGCSVEDVTFNATGGYSGILKSIGVNGGYYNAKVIGGQYGVYMNSHRDPLSPRTITEMFPIFTGCRFYGQTKRVLYTDGRCPTTFVGCHFTKTAPGPLFETRKGSHQQGGNLTFMDCVFELPASGTAIDNSYLKSGEDRGRSIFIKDAYFKNAEEIIVSPGSTKLGNGSGWSFVGEYARTLTSLEKNGENLIDGNTATNTPEMSDSNSSFQVTDVSEPDINKIVANHLWDETTFPAFDDPGVYNLVTGGGLDNTNQLDVTTMLNDLLRDEPSTTFFLPKGIYKISGTITLSASKRLFGVSRAFSALRPDYQNWVWPSGDKNNEDYILTTGDLEADAPLLSNVWFDFTHYWNPGYMLSVIHWKAGQGSMIRNIFAWDGKHGGYDPSVSRKMSVLNKKIFRFSGNAGGRMYGISASWQHTSNGTAHDSARAIYVSDTDGPLNFYSYNVERQVGRFQSEFNNASNINVFGCKTEGENVNAWEELGREDDRPMLGITNGCSNITVGTVATSKIGCKDGWVQIRGSTNILCANVTSQNDHPDLNLIEEFLLDDSNTENPDFSISAGKQVAGVFRRGITTLNDFELVPGNTNRRPTIAPIAPITMEEECIHVLAINVTDPDAGDTLSLSVFGLPSFARLTQDEDGTNVIVFAPTEGDANTYNGITVTADDGNTESNTHQISFDLTVDEYLAP